MPESLMLLKRIVYRGPTQQVCYALSEHGYAAILVPGAVYELPVDLADSLLRSSVHFTMAPKESVFALKGSEKSAASTDEQENK